MRLRDLQPADLPLILALNNAHAAEVNFLSAEQLAQLVSVASYARLVDDGLAFLCAFDETVPVQGPNHGWFVQRLPRFMYIDRVVVSSEARGRGLARALYDDLQAVAGDRPLVCEVNLEPLNEPSLVFHERLGFTPCGEATDPRNGKRVRYLERVAASPTVPH